MPNGIMIANDGLERMWKESVVGYLKYNLGSLLETLRKVTINLSQYRLSQG
jgi:hypothetical protein